ncbi:hypothetical protein BGX24_007805, partial [Mortierella sp. AD032]
MKYLSLLVVAVLAFGSTGSDAVPTFISNSHNKAATISDKYIVVLKDAQAINSFDRKFNLLSSRIQNGRNRGNAKPPKINHRFKSIPGFTKSPPSWGLPRVSQRGRVAQGSSYKYANSAGAGVTAYVVDTGINTGHTDFGGRAKMGNNFIQGSPNTDENGHGTHVF